MRKDDDLRDRTKQFALRVIRLFQALPRSTEAQVIGKQMIRSGTSVAANYREASRGRSKAELRSKLGIVEQELDVTMLRIELVADLELLSRERLEHRRDEAEQLLKIVVTSIVRLRD